MTENPVKKYVEFEFYPLFTYASPPEVITPDKTLSTSADRGVAKVLPNLNGLVDGSITISEVGRLWAPEMKSQAFCRAVIDQIDVK